MEHGRVVVRMGTGANPRLQSLCSHSGASSDEVRMGHILHRKGLAGIFTPFWDSVLGPTIAGHLHNPGIKPSDNFDQVLLLTHDGVDVLVDRGHFVRAGGKDVNSFLLQILLNRLEAVLLAGLRAAHTASRAVRSGVETLWVSFATNNVCGRGHRAGNDSQNSLSCGGRSLAMHDQLAAAVHLFPSEVVVI